MAAVAVGLRGPATASLFPRLGAPVVVSSSRWATVAAIPLSIRLPFLPGPLPLALPAVSIDIFALVGDIWGSIWRAVPKKKTSYSRTRSRQLAGKALQDVTNLCPCPGCGQLKRTHRVCSDCLKKIHRAWQRQSELEAEGEIGVEGVIGGAGRS